MKIIVGLGNPGKEYEGTRHNVGFEVVERLGEKWGGEWRLVKKVESEVASLRIGSMGTQNRQSKGDAKIEEVYLLKPMTFMNRSGEAIKKFLEFYKLSVVSCQLFVVHDEIDLELGRLKIQIGGGAAGHHGVESVLNQLKGIDVVRFRMGVGRPEERLGVRDEGRGAREQENRETKEQRNKGTEELETRNLPAQAGSKLETGANWVLGRFSSEERKVIEEMIDRTVEAVECGVREGVERAMNRYNA